MCLGLLFTLWCMYGWNTSGWLIGTISSTILITDNQSPPGYKMTCHFFKAYPFWWAARTITALCPLIWSFMEEDDSSYMMVPPKWNTISYTGPLNERSSTSGCVPSGGFAALFLNLHWPDTVCIVRTRIISVDFPYVFIFNVWSPLGWLSAASGGCFHRRDFHQFCLICAVVVIKTPH